MKTWCMFIAFWDNDNCLSKHGNKLFNEEFDDLVL